MGKSLAMLYLNSCDITFCDYNMMTLVLTLINMFTLRNHKFFDVINILSGEVHIMINSCNLYNMIFLKDIPHHYILNAFVCVLKMNLSHRQTTSIKCWRYIGDPEISTRLNK
uniref:Uncharacterized protein n=1 Tax=Cacopsylla melanoneura TaxID=428564 RepID=A0A8D8TRT2_9HEMI